MRYRQLYVYFVLAATAIHNLAKPLAPPWDDIRVKHTWNTVPPNWETVDNPPAGTVTDLHVALKPHHENALVDALYEVSDPRSPKYGAHLSKEQVAQLVAPHPATLQLIKTWLENHDIPSSSISLSGGNWLTVTGVPVPQANELLCASYQLYRRTGTNDTILRTIGYALPAVLHQYVQTIVPTTYFASTGTLSQTSRRRPVGVTEDMEVRKPPLITPSELRSLYRTATYEPNARDRNKLGLLGHQNEYPSEEDLNLFMTNLRSGGVHANYTVVKINGGGYDPRHPGTEGNLDMQYAQAMAYPTPHVFYSVGGRIAGIPESNKPAEDDQWFAWLKYLINEPEVPQTISVSYGNLERDIPPEYATALCEMFAQLGARGVSVLVASGDDGVGEGECKTYDGSGRVQFIPEFPSSCPYVTSVGGTMGKPEVAASLSGGGFSNYFARPPYQDDEVPIFLDRLGGRYEDLYNSTSRGIPDIAAQSVRFLIVKDHKAVTVNGTSAAAPTVAGIISLLNDYLLSEDRAPLGFLNPWLYGYGLPGINDITDGSNPGCGTEGFSATRGWDPVTGLGTLDFASLQYMLYIMDHTA